MDNWRIEVFFDGDCPLCVKEIGMLRWMDRKNRIRFTDIAEPVSYTHLTLPTTPYV